MLFPADDLLDSLLQPLYLMLLNQTFTVLESSLFSFTNSSITPGDEYLDFLNNASSTNIWRLENFIWMIITEAAND